MDNQSLSHPQSVHVVPAVPPDVQAINALMIPLSQVMGQIEQTRAESEKVRISAELEKARMENATYARQVNGVLLVLGGFALAGVVALFMPSLTTIGEKLIFGVMSFFAGWGIGKKVK